MRVPSGVSYVLANRSAMRPQWAEALGKVRLRPVSHYPQRLLAALRRAAPAGVSDPCVVVLTPGVYNSAYFEHAWLARAMGVELVEGRDLICTGGTVRMRDTRGERRVDVIYRRVDDEFLDPVQFRHDSMLGCPGMLTVARAGNVSIANAVGNGVADDKLVYTYLPDLVRYYLGEEPVLPNVQHLAPRGAGRVAGGPGPAAGAGGQAGRRRRRQGTGDRPTGLVSGARPRWPNDSGPTRGGGSPSPSYSCRPCRPSPVMASPPGTSTSDRSRSTTATTCGCCPAA